MYRSILLKMWCLIALFAPAVTPLLAQQTEAIALRVVEQERHEPLEAVSIIISPTQAVYTDKQGRATLPRGIKGESVITIRYIGYKEQRIEVKNLVRQSARPYTICLIPESSALEEVFVHAERRSTSVSAVAAKIDADQIDRSIGKSLASLLEGVSGVSTIQTGSNTAKPVIHGMHGNRILIVNNGVRQSGQQWGEGHAPELDMSSSGAIHVVKGAESVRYGAEAMGGTIVMDQKALPYHQHLLSGRLNSLYGSNGQRYAGTLSLEGAIHKTGDWAWRLQGAYNASGDRHTAHYMLNNTGSQGSNISATLGYSHGGIKVEGNYTRYEEASGTLQSAQMGNVEILRERIDIGRPPADIIQPFSRRIDYPRDKVVHHTASAKASYQLRKFGTLFYQFAQQWDDRREYRIRRNNNSHIPEVALNLSAQQHQARWEHGYQHWQTEVGGQYIHTNNYSTPGNGVVPLIPNYVDGSWGVYSIQKYAQGRWNAEAGVRLDGQRTKAAGYNSYGEEYGGERKFLNLTYSLSARFKPSRHWSLTSNFGAAWRAPHVHELYSSGVEHGSGAYILGDEHLKSEKSYKWVSSITYQNSWLNISLDGYLQWVDNFIYDEPQRGEYFTVISGAYPVFRYKQTAAFFRGLDLDVQLHPTKSLSYGLTTALIWANEMKTNLYLPYIPPLRLDHHLSWHWHKGKQIEGEITFSHRFVGKQTRFDPNKDLIPYTPDAYHLLGGEASVVWRYRGEKSLRLSISGENLLNHEYKEYTNRARYYSHDLGRDVSVSLGWHF